VKKAQIEIGGRYFAKVSGRLQVVQIDAVSPHGGWLATNVRTQRAIHIRSAARLRGHAADQPKLAARVSTDRMPPQEETPAPRRVWDVSAARDTIRAAEQAVVNAAPRRAQADLALRYAAQQHSPLRQYDGHYDNWELVVVKRRVCTKLGVAFEPGDVTLGSERWNHSGWVLYSLRNGCDTLVAGDVERLPSAATHVSITIGDDETNCTLEDAIAANADSAEVLEALEQIGVGEERVLGGGAAPEVTITGFSWS
jgi:hypothetical protein